MKNIKYIMLLLILVISTSAFSQQKKVTLSLKNVKVETALDALKAKSGLSYWFDANTVNMEKVISVNIKSKTVKEALGAILQGQNVSFKITGDHIVISKLSRQVKPDPEKTSSNAEGSIRIGGTVSDKFGVSVPGATIAIKGTTKAVATDANGEFTMNVPNENSVLLIKMVGYEDQEVVVGKRSILGITLEEKQTNLKEVTVVAYGQQKKNSVIGSITTLEPGNLKIPSSNLTSALAGNMAGLIAYQRTGEPGQDNADFFVRGITTFGTNTSPLILIDGIELTATDLSRLQVDDIASFSIMKDATATALYGARGANGVILVTTKGGEFGKAKISFRLENSTSAPTQNVELADPVTYMEMANEAVSTRNPLGEQPYSQEKIDNTAAGINPLMYPANDWKKMLFKDYTMNQRANLSVSGGGGVAKYYVAASYNRDNGILQVDNRNNFNNNIAIDNYTLRANVNINIFKTTEMIVRLNGNFEDYTGPLQGGSQMYNMVMHSNPVQFPAYYPVNAETNYVQHIMFGNFNNSYTNPYAESVRGYKDESQSEMTAQLEMKQDLNMITKGLSIRAMLNVLRQSDFSYNRSYNPYYYQLSSYDEVTGNYSIYNTNTDGTEYLNYSEGPKTLNATVYLETMANYLRTFNKKHSVSGLLVYTMRDYIKANAGSLQASLPSRNLGVSGRATYSYNDRYFAEFNFGYNGSERFDINHRFGFFPSAGAAWFVSNEDFWAPFKDIFSKVKLRYSYGLVGNDQIGSAADRFFYLSEMNMSDGGRASTFGKDLNYTLNGVSVGRYANSNITWETAKKQNIALDLGLWNNINLITEFYTENRKNILMTRSYIPTTMGIASGATPKSNVGAATGKGVDISLDYQKNWTKDFWTSARANYTFSRSKYKIYEEPVYPEPWRTHIGNSLSQTYGYIAERLFVSDEDARNSPSQDFGSVYGAGDIKYTDVNHDGKITTADMVPIGNPTSPEIIYGFGFSMGYKNLDFSAFFQGLGNESFWIDPTTTAPFQNNTQVLKAYADSYWSEEKQNIYATWPRLSSDINYNNIQTSTWFMRDGSFLRLKQLEVGYSLPKRMQKPLGLSNLRIYANGSNLLLWSHFKLWDVEMAGNGLAYPIQRVTNIGLNVSF